MYCEILKMIELLQNYLQAVDVRVGAATLIILVVPTTFSLLFWFGSTIVKVPIRLMATVVLLSLIGWVMVVIGCLIRPGNHDGSSLIFVLFGWAYVWIVGLPIMLMSLFLRGLFMLRRWWRRKMANQQMPQDCPRLLVVVLLVGMMVVHSVIEGFNSGAVWRTWSGGQYRMVHSDGFVHMQICDSSGVSDVRTEETVYVDNMDKDAQAALATAVRHAGFELADVVFLQAECDCEVLQ